MEEWRNIKDWEGQYQISSKGRVKSLERVVRFGNQKRVIKEKILTPHIKGTCRYYQVNLSRKGKQSWKLVHKLVAEAFLEVPEKYKHLIGTRKLNINHKDENIYNNNVENIEYISCLENQLYGTKLERQSETMRKHNEENRKKYGKIYRTILYNR